MTIKKFLFEFLIVVAGVLVALALNGWNDSRLEARSEANYLALLSRDLDDTIQDLEALVEFEGKQLDDALNAYRAVTATEKPANTAVLAAAMARLATRKTMVLKNSTYEDLVSTGHLHLIRNAALRNRVVDFYEVTERQFEIVNRNNAFYIDNMYTANVTLSGLVQFKVGTNHPGLNNLADELTAKLGPGYQIDHGRLWKLPADAPEWSMVKSNLVARATVSTFAQAGGNEKLTEARVLKAAIDEERG